MVQEKDWQGELRRTGIALMRNAADAQALLDRGVAASKLNDWDMAIASWEQARTILGDRPALMRNLVRGHLRRRDVTPALALLEPLLAQDREDPESRAVQGVALMQCGRWEEALDAMRRCSAKRGLDHEENNFNMATILMILGRWAEGLPLYERRWSHVDAGTQAIHRHLSTVPAWNPVTDSATDLVIGTEQGSGDIIMMARYLPILAERVRSVTAMAQPPLVGLLSRSFSHVPNLRIIARGEVPLTGDSRHLMYMSILHALGVQPQDIPARDGYLSAADWTGNRRHTRSRPAVGLSWQGSAGHPEDDLRSLPAALVVPFLERSPHVDFYALSPPSMLPLRGSAPANLHFPVADGEGFEVTAGLMEEMDLVISVDSAPCHLAGALGVPVWTLLHRHPDWRWGDAADGETPWYGSMTLLRQPTAGDWAGLLEQVTERLNGLGLGVGGAGG